MSQQVKVYRELQLLNKGIITTNQDMVIVDDELISKRTQNAMINTAGVSVSDLIAGVIDGTPTGAANYTLPDASDLVAGIANCKVGSSFLFVINNKSSGANTITVVAGSGGTADGTVTIAQNKIRAFLIIITSITSSEAYFVYGLGA